MSVPRYFSRALVCLALVTLPIAWHSAEAQVAVQSQQQLNPAGRLPPEEEQKQQGDILSAPESGPCPKAFLNPNISLTLTSVTFNGGEDLGADAFAPTYQEFIGKTVSLSTVCEIRDRASRLLFHRGILARVDIPLQTIHKGALALQITESYVSAVEVHGDAGPAQQKVADYVDMLKGMKPFDINKAQRYLFLAHDIPGIRLSAVLKPAKQGPGAIILDITVTRAPLSATVNVQNFDSKETGLWAGTARVDFNSFTPLGERLSLVAFSAPDFREDHVFQGIEQFRPGSGGLLATVSFAYGYSRPGGDLSPLKLDSKSYVGAFNLSLPLIRGRDENANIEGGLDIVDQSLYSFVTPDVRATLSDDRLSVLHLKIGGDRDWRTLESPVKISGDIEARQGVSSFGASNAGDPLLSRSGGQPDAWDLRAQGFFNVQWLPQFGTSLSLTGQYARERLLAYEDFNVGNLTVVRGYDPAALTGDEGVGGAFQANVGGFRLTDMLEVGGYGFYDMAYVKNFDVSDEDAVVRSIGAGATFNLSYWSQWSADVAYAHPLGTGSLLPQERPSSNRILVNLTYQY